MRAYGFLHKLLKKRVSYKCMDGQDGSPGGVKYRAAYAANNCNEAPNYSEVHYWIIEALKFFQINRKIAKQSISKV